MTTDPRTEEIRARRQAATPGMGIAGCVFCGPTAVQLFAVKGGGR